MKYQDKVKEIENLLDDNIQIKLLDGFEDALCGYDYTDVDYPTPLYDYYKMIDILVKRDKMTKEQAIEHIDYNVVGSIKLNDRSYPRIVLLFKNNKRKR